MFHIFLALTKQSKNIIACVTALFKQDNPTLRNLNALKESKRTIAKASHAQNTRRTLSKFKTKGLKLESIHLMKSSRVVNLFMFMAIAYCYSCKIGEIVNMLKPSKLKQLKNNNNSIRTTKEFSLFNRGADLLKILVDNHLSYKAVIFKQLFRILSSPPNTCIDKRLAIVRIIMIR